MGTDFFDDDLTREREAALKIKLNQESGGARDGFIPSSREMQLRPVSDLTLTPLARQKQEVSDQMADKAQELDRLRARQEELERERRTLEELRAKQEALDAGRRELKDGLQTSLVKMEKDQLEAERLAELLDETRRVFRERLDEVTALNEDEWADEHLLEELNKALALLENIRSDYNKALARIAAVHPQAADPAKPLQQLVLDAAGAGGASLARRDFRDWLRAGLAFTLPLLILLTLLTLVWFGFYFWM